jgi:hypothetical protein
MKIRDWTAKELAEKIGCDTKTVANHANNLYGPGEERVTRLFDEMQAQAIASSIIKARDRGASKGGVVTAKDTITAKANFAKSRDPNDDLDEYTPIRPPTPTELQSAEERARIDRERTERHIERERKIEQLHQQIEDELNQDIAELRAELYTVKEDNEELTTVSNWLIKGHQALGERAMNRYGGELPYWQR